MKMRITPALSLIALISGTAAVAAPLDPVLAKVVAGARSVTPSSISFERVTKRAGREGDGPAETVTRVDRWDGKTLTLISIDGKSPTADEAAATTKAGRERPLAGYHRVAEYLSAGARRISEKPGQIVYRVDKMPKGSVNLNGDKSDKFIGDVTVDVSGPVPVATRTHIYLAKPFSIMMVAKVDRFDVVNEYAIGKDSRPMLLRSVQQLAGAQFGKAGESRSEASYTTLR